MKPFEIQVYQLLPSGTYPRAPIIEAVIQLREVADVDARLQKKVVQKLKRAYPHQQPVHAFEVALDNTGGSVAVAQESEGFRLANDDQTDVLIINARGVTAVRLAPYTGWPALRGRAEAAWNVWREAAPGHAIERLGIRMINRIDIPATAAPTRQLEDFLHLRPALPALSHAPMDGFLVQVSIPTFDPMWKATLTSTLLLPMPVPGHYSILLDIDVSRTTAIPLNDALLWPIIDHARAIKNDPFERCITDATRKLFA